jgi:hypothetical protein
VCGGLNTVVLVATAVVLLVLHTLVVVLTDPVVDVAPMVLLVVLEAPSVVAVTASSSSSLEPKYQEGSSTGVRNTMMQTTATRQPPATPSNLRLCSIAPRRAAKKNPLSRKKRTMLTELFTNPGYQNAAPADTGRGGRHPVDACPSGW